MPGVLGSGAGKPLDCCPVCAVGNGGVMLTLPNLVSPPDNVVVNAFLLAGEITVGKPEAPRCNQPSLLWAGIPQA